MDKITRELQSARELTEILKTLQDISSLDMSVIKLDKQTVEERHFTELERKTVERRIKGKVKPDRRRRGVGRMHWAAKRKKQREVYKEKVYPKLLRERRAEVTTEGWFPRLERGWKAKGYKVLVTKEEFDTYVSPVIKATGSIPFVERYDTSSKTISLEGIVIYSQGTSGRKKRHEVPLFDGKEYAMRRDGYIL